MPNVDWVVALMPWWGWTAIGVLGYGWVWRITFRWLAEEEERLTWSDFWAIAAVSAFLFWLVAVFRTGDALKSRTTPEKLARMVAGESRAARRRRRERELREREERIMQSEKELGIGV